MTHTVAMHGEEKVFGLSQKQALASIESSRQTPRPLMGCAGANAMRSGLAICLAALAAALPASLGAQAFQPVAGLSFTMPVGGPSPLPQVLTAASDAAPTQIKFKAAASTASGGNWLQLPSGFTEGDPATTPSAIQIGVIDAVAKTLAAGSYTGQIVLTSVDGKITLKIPVTLTVSPPTAAFFDSLPGQITFSMETASGNGPPSQSFQIRNAGAGTLSWTVTASTLIGSGWLKVSSAKGSGTSTVMATILPLSLPGGGTTAGTYLGQLTVSTSGSTVTIPVAVNVGAADHPAFEQANALNFTMPYGTADPLPQVLTVASAATAVGLEPVSFKFLAAVFNAKGGDWLHIPSALAEGNSGTTTWALPVTVSQTGLQQSLAPGIYTAEILITSVDSSRSMTLPVTLTVTSPSTTAFFDNLPGSIDFSLENSAAFPPPGQPFQIRNAGTGPLNWTGTATTSDGGSWLHLSATSGTAPSPVTVTISPGSLPGAGQASGTYTGQIVLLAAGQSVTIPVSVTVGDSSFPAFAQVNALNFTMPYGTVDPLPQVLTVASAATSVGVEPVEISFKATVSCSKGGDWLHIPSAFAEGNSGTTTWALPVIVSQTGLPQALEPGIYTAEIVITSTDGFEVMTVPVTLTVTSSSTAAFLGNLPGGVTFSMATGGSAPSPQSLEIRNAGTGTLNWTVASSNTSDGGKWLVLSAASGTAPGRLTVSVAAQNLPGGGQAAGTYSGQIVLSAAGVQVAIPVTVSVGASVFQFKPSTALNFTQPYGGASPPAQDLTIDSTDAKISFGAAAATATKGGNWLQIPNGFAEGGSAHTPYSTFQVNVNGAGLNPGAYLGQILFTSAENAEAQIVPVTLTVEGSTAAAAPVITPAGAHYATAPAVTITDATPDSAIYYTTNGTAPTASSAIYSGPVQVEASETLKAIAAAAGYPNSPIASAAYYIGVPTAKPTFSPVAGPYTSAQTVTIADATTAAIIHYTTNGQSPTVDSPTYTSSLTVSATETIEAIAVADGYAPSTVATATYMIHPPADQPTFSPKPGPYTSAQTITISDATKNATIYCTTNGDTPTVTASDLCKSSIQVSATETIKAIATAPGYTQSAVAAGTYTITLTTATPTFSPAQGTYTGTQHVSILCATTGATIYYTTDGSPPTASSNKYANPIAVSASETIEATAVALDYAQSATAIAVYTIKPAAVAAAAPPKTPPPPGH